MFKKKRRRLWSCLTCLLCCLLFCLHFAAAKATNGQRQAIIWFLKNGFKDPYYYIPRYWYIIYSMWLNIYIIVTWRVLISRQNVIRYLNKNGFTKNWFLKNICIETNFTSELPSLGVKKFFSFMTTMPLFSCWPWFTKWCLFFSFSSFFCSHSPLFYYFCKTWQSAYGVAFP